MRLRLVPPAVRALLLGASLLMPSVGFSQGLSKPNGEAAGGLQAAIATLDRSPDAIAAEVGTAETGRRTITWGDVADSLRALPAGVAGMPFQQLYESTTLHMAQQAALALKAEADGLAKDPGVMRRLRQADDQVLADAELRHALAPRLTDAALRKLYDGNVAGKPGPVEVQARIIMITTASEANALIARLHEGADFADLARQFSKDGSAANGGDLGYARLDMLNPALGAVAFSLAPGQMTAYPVEMNNAYFIVRVEGRRQPPAPSFELAKPALEQDVLHASAPGLLQAMLHATPIQYYGLTGKVPPKRVQ